MEITELKRNYQKIFKDSELEQLILFRRILEEEEFRLKEILKTIKEIESIKRNALL